MAFLFTLGNSSNSFLLLRAYDVGFSAANAILLYFLFNAVSAVLSVPFGRYSDKIGRKKVLISGYIVFAVVYLGFAFAFSKPVLIGAFALYGVYTAMVAGVERALIAEIAPADLKGTMLGLHSTLVGIALLPASVIAGFLWDVFGASAPFCFGALMSLLAALLLAFFFRTGEKTPAGFAVSESKK